MKRLTFTLPDELHRKAKIKAAQTGVSIAEICRRALAEWVKDDEEKEQSPREEQ